MLSSLTVVVPTRNAMPFLKSILPQLELLTSLGANVIVVDGTSNDESSDVLKKLANDSSLMKFFERIPNGLYDAWNFGVRQAVTEFVAVLPVDDVASEAWYHFAVDWLNRHPGFSAVFCKTVARQRSSNNQSTPPSTEWLLSMLDLESPSVEVHFQERSLLLSHLLLGPVVGSMHSVVFRRSMVDEFPQEYGSVGDFFWSASLDRYGSVAFFPLHKTYWIRHRHQATGRFMSPESQDAMVAMHDALIERHTDQFSLTMRSELKMFHMTMWVGHYSRPSVPYLLSCPLRGLHLSLRYVLKNPVFSFRKFRGFLSGYEVLEQVGRHAARKHLQITRDKATVVVKVKNRG